MNYIDLGLFGLYVIFFISYNIYWNRRLKKDAETFFEFAGKDFTWYKGPIVNFFVFIMCGIVVFLDMAYSGIISNDIFSFLASLGSLAVFFGFAMLLGTIIENRKKKTQKK